MDAIHVIDFKKGDKTELAALIKVAKEIKEDGFTSDSWAEFQKALADAEKVNKDDDAMADEIKEAYDALHAAMEELKLSAAKDQLNVVIEKAKEVLNNLDAYSNTKEEKDALQDAYDKAVAVYEDADVTQEEVTAETLNLNDVLSIGMFVQVSPAVVERSKKGTGFISNKFLRLGIILLGFKLNLVDLADAGVKTILLAIFVVTFTILGVYTLARKFGVDSDLAILVASGTGICGAAAVMGVSPQIQVPEDQREL